MKKEWKVYIKGVEDRGDEVFEALKELGAQDTTSLTGGYDEKIIYYINHSGFIDYVGDYSETAKIIMDNYREIKLPEKWKDGDIIFSPKFETFAVYKYDDITRVYFRVTKTDIISYPTRALKENYRLATPKEIEHFHELLHKYHKEWDVNNKQLVDWKWIPEMTHKFYFVDINGNVKIGIHDKETDNAMFEFGNCFRTKEEAETMAEKIRDLLNAES